MKLKVSLDKSAFLVVARSVNFKATNNIFFLIKIFSYEYYKKKKMFDKKICQIENVVCKITYLKLSLWYFKKYIGKLSGTTNF